MDMEHFFQLRSAWDRFGEDDDAYVAIVTGVGKDFCVGADLKTYIPQITEMQKKMKEGVQPEELGGYRLDDGVKAVLRGTKLYKPIIAAVNGTCVAGGMEMLGGTDLPGRQRHRHLRGHGAQARAVRRRRAPRCACPVRSPGPPPWSCCSAPTRCRPSAPTKWGWSTRCAVRPTSWSGPTTTPHRITANGPFAVRKTKESALRGLATDMKEAYRIESEISGEVFSSEDAKEGPRAFAEKRAPNWKNR